MLEYLAKQARKNIWCNPHQDYQVIFRPARITPVNGVENRFRVMWTNYKLPTQGERYHVYQIGQRFPITLGLPAVKEQWLRFSDVCMSESLIADFYTTSGIQFPRTEAWLWIGPDKSVLIAIKRNDKIADLNFQPLFVRLYSNAYFNSVRRKADDRIVVKGKLLETTNDRIAFQRDYEDHSALRGHAYAFVNGLHVHNVTPSTAELGDYVEFVYDSSIYRVIDIPISSLKDFNSIKDNAKKYLVHYSDMLNNFIDYFDDIDFWLTNKVGDNTAFTGVYYHKNQEESVRMVTHKDYSLPVASVNQYAQDHDLWDTPAQMNLRLHVRLSGYERPLSDEHHRIKELYKLSSTDTLNAMLGVDSNVEVWRAENLENSDYTAIMEDEDGYVSPSRLQGAYGYNAIAKLTAESTLDVVEEGGIRYVKIPPGLQRQSTVYEYTAQGTLLGFHLHSNQEHYVVVNPNAARVEVIYGHGSWNQGTVYGEQDLQLDTMANHRFYLCPVVNGVPTEEWTDVTGDSTKYLVTDKGIVQWNVNLEYYMTAVRSDDRHLAYTIDVDSTDGVTRFSINAEEPWFGIVSRRVNHLPPGRLDIWMNGQCLIENLDYIVKWPQVVITNKGYRNNTSETITVRATGFCRPDMSRERIEDFGFVEYGLLSHNNRHDLRDDKVVRVVVGGKLRKKDELKFAEDHAGVTFDGVPNGTPYTVSDVAVPVRGLVGDVFDFMDRSKAVDKAVSDYLTLKLPQPPRSVPSPIKNRYRIYSPLVSKVIHALKEGILGGPEIEGQYSDDFIWKTLEKNYLYLVDYEPTKIGYDENYVAVHPHPYDYVVDLNIFQYNFVRRMIKVVLDDKISLTSHVRMVELNHE